MKSPRKDPANPKDVIGSVKAAISCISFRVMTEVSLAMMEGARKYGRHNYRAAPVRASIYYDAFHRHAGAWWEGEDIDPDSGEARLHHLSKAIASLTVLRDAMLKGTWIDDRPPAHEPGWMADVNVRARAICEMYPDPPPPFTQAPDPDAQD